MKRNEIIQKLISEGFSEKTLVNFTDKQLNDLSSRMLGEQEVGGQNWGKGGTLIRLPKGSNNTNDAIRIQSELRGDKYMVGIMVQSNKKVRSEIKGNTIFKTVESMLGNKFQDQGDWSKTSGTVDFNTYNKIVKLLSSLSVDEKNNTFVTQVSGTALNEQSSGKGAVIMKKSSNPTDIKRVTDSGMNVELREKEEGGLNDVDTLKSDEITKIWNNIKGGEQPSRKEMKLDIFKHMKKHDCTLNSLKEKHLNESQLEINEWIGNLAETKYHSFTSKNEIMELISMKLNESEAHQYGPGVTVGHNGIPEWFSSKAIKGNNPAPVIAPPKTKPGTTPKRRNPYQPGPGPNPRPDAIMELGEQQPAPVIAPPKVKPGTTPKRRNPYQPGPGPNPRPDAKAKK